jgi:HEAT repeat protein
MSRPGELLWRMLPAVRSGERSRTLFFAGLLTAISAAQTMGLAGSEALLLAEFGAERLPETFIAASLVTVLGSILYAARVGSARNDEFFGQMLIAAALLLGVATVLAGANAVWVLPALFCFFYLSQAIFLNHFWTFSGDYFDTLASKRLFPTFTVGASLGGLLGGAATAMVARSAGPVALVAAWGGLLLVAALMLRAGRRGLRRWGPLELEEADETSVEGMRGAARCIRTSPLGRWLVVSVLGMVLALFIAQYLYSDIFVRAYPDPSELAIFLGLYLAITNLVEIALELLVTPWLIRRLGVPTANLVHPILMLASFGGLAFHHGLAAGVGARASRELVENAVAQPLRTLLHNALPLRFRGRIRAFLEGIVVYAGMSVAGLLLLVAGAPDPLWLCVGGGAAALLYLVANLGVRREYLRTLISGIRAGRLDLPEIEGEIGHWEVTHLARLCEQMLRDESGSASRSLLQILPALADHGVVEPLLSGMHHPSPDVRRACTRALTRAPLAGAIDVLIEALSDSDAEIRLIALRALAAREPAAPALAIRREALDADPDPRVRAESALHCGEIGATTLRRMIASSDRSVAIAALRVAPPSLGDAALERLQDADPAVRAAAVERAAYQSERAPIPLRELVDALADSHAGVRRSALLALSGSGDPEADRILATALADVAKPVRRLAVERLAARGERGVAAALPHLRSEDERATRGALEVIAASGVPRHREILASELQHWVRQLWFRLIAHRRLPAQDGGAAAFLRVAYADALLRSRRLAFRTLELIEHPQIIRKVEKTLRFGSVRSRADALEVLSNLGDREAARLLVLYHEGGPLEDRIAAVETSVRVPGDSEALISASRRSEVRWIRMAAEALDETVRDNRVWSQTMDRLIALKQVPLFANLTLDQLEAVGQLVEESVYVRGETIVREGDPGGELFLLLEGAVEVYLQHGTAAQERLSVLEAVDYFGEMAIFDDEPRSASVVARDSARLLALDGASLKELILQMPEISFEFFRVLTRRVRAAERRDRKR